MQQLFTLFMDSFVIWSRNFTLVYIFLLGLFVFGVILGQAGSPGMDWHWFLLAFILLLILAAMMAGWFNMVALACVRFLEAQPRGQALQPVSPLDAFSLFRAFLPGIGRFFVNIAFGYFIQIAVATLLLLAAQPLWVKNTALLEKMASLGLDDRLRYIETLSQAQLTSLSELSLFLLGALVVYAVFAMLIMLWPAFVVYYGDNALKACWRSIRQFLRDPLRLVAISLFLLALKIPFFFLGSSLNPTGSASVSFLAAGVQLLSLLVEIYAAIVIFVYVYQAVGKPVLVLDEPASDDTADEPPSL
jgi:hypothetical protein